MVSWFRKTVIVLGIAIGVSACSDEPTQIIVAVDTDFSIPSELDTIHFDVTGPDGRVQSSDALLSGADAPSLPRTLALTRGNGALGPYEVRVTGLSNSAEVIERRARVSFIEGRSVGLILHLLRSCRALSCGAEQSCDIEGCRAIDVDPAELLDWAGKPEHLDGGVPFDMNRPDYGNDMTVTPDACGSAELCNGLDDNCNTRIDEDFDLLNDVDNCGACGHACPALPVGSGTRSCVNGQCKALCIGLDSADCDQFYGNGCESPLDSPLTCGSCLTMCVLQHATAGCAVDMSTAMCSVSACGAGYDDCDDNARNGCETNINTDVNHCGSCAGTDSNCPDTPDHGTSRCQAGSCLIDCDPGYEDCDGRADNGCEANMNDPATCGSCDIECPGGQPFCEGSVRAGFACVSNCTTGELCGSSCVDTTTNAQNCMTCGHVCPSGANSQPRCSSSTCGLACDVGYENCDGVAANGCEQNVRVPSHCGTCTNVCNLPHVSEYSCMTGSCGIALCAEGFEDCNGVAEDGCEVDTRSDNANCGSCERSCAADPAHADSVCMEGMCQLACDPGYQDCGAADGCETPLSSSAHCGECHNACSGSDALCLAGMSGTYSCVATCGGGTNELCGTSCVDTATDAANCMSCGHICTVPPMTHAVATCATSACGFQCDTNYGNCDAMAGNGCESNFVNDVDHCGSCLGACPAASNAMRTCAAGTCGFHCNAGYGDCDGSADGCETMTNTTANCGECGHVCPSTGVHVDSGTCDSGGVCHLVCSSDKYSDCDGDLSNGCEVSLDDDPLNCGGCGTPCGSSESCCGGSCCNGVCLLGACVGGTVPDGT
jgi:hypothetical protein